MRFRWFALACVVAVGCSQAKTRAPYLADDCTQNCGFGASSTRVPGVDGGGLVGAGGQGNGTVTGQVSVFRDATFTASDPFTGNGLIWVQGVHSVPGTLSGTNFTVEHTDVAESLWVAIEETRDSGTGTLMPTVTLVDGTANNVDVAFVKTSVMTEIAQLVSPVPPAVTPPALDSSLAQIFVRFVNASGNPAPSGIQLSQRTNVLYDAPSPNTTTWTYTDAFGSTKDNGIAIVVNASASTQLPSLAKTQLQYQTLASTSAVTINAYVAQGAVTIVTVIVPP